MTEQYHFMGLGIDKHIFEHVIKDIVVILIVLLAAFVIVAIGNSLIMKFFRSVHKVTQTDNVEALKRAETVGHIVSNIWKIVAWIIALLVAMLVTGLDITPPLAGVTVIGAALAFGAQTLVKDYLSGILLVVENQLKVGDWVSVGEVTGRVTGFTLRIVTVEDSDGTLWYIANGDIRKVGNYGHSPPPSPNT